MKMEAGLDRGPVFSAARIGIEACDSYKSLHDKLALLGAEILARDIAAICRGVHRTVRAARGVEAFCQAVIMARTSGAIGSVLRASSSARRPQRMPPRA